jgi:hypothetical protein
MREGQLEAVWEQKRGKDRFDEAFLAQALCRTGSLCKADEAFLESHRSSLAYARRTGRLEAFQVLRCEINRQGIGQLGRSSRSTLSHRTASSRYVSAESTLKRE